MAVILPVQNDMVTEFLLLSDDLHKSVQDGHCISTVNNLCKQGAKRLFQDSRLSLTNENASYVLMIFQDSMDNGTRLWYACCPEIDFYLYHYPNRKALMKEVRQRLSHEN